MATKQKRVVTNQRKKKPPYPKKVVKKEPSVNGNGQPELFGNRRPMNMFQEVIANAMLSRKQLISDAFDPRRNINDECGYPETENISRQNYKELYDREPIAARVVEILPKETWKGQPTVFETEDVDTPTPFEEAWDNLDKTLRGTSWYQDEEGSPIWEALLRADILSGVGRFGVMLLGFDDGEELNIPVKGIDERGLQERTGEATRKLLFIRSFDESLVTVANYEDDLANPRYGQPLMYNITLNDPGDVPQVSSNPDTTTKLVHWSRVIHLADNLRASEVFGVPRMQPNYNRLLDLRKLYSGSAEMYWKGAFPGYSFEIHPQLAGNVDIDKKAFRDESEQWINGLQRVFLADGMSIKGLAPQVVDPTPQIDTQIEAICIQQGIPKRKFTGSERGELASSEDESDWNDVLRSRQTNYVTPRIIIPFVDRLIAVGVLPVPDFSPEVEENEEDIVSEGGEDVVTEEREPGGYSIKWPDLDSLSEQEQAGVALTKTDALVKYVQGGVEALIPPMDYLTRFMGEKEEEAEGILEAAEEHSEEIADEEAEEVERMEEAEGKVLGDMKAEAAKASAFAKLEPSANVSKEKIEEINNEFEEVVNRSTGTSPVEKEVLRAKFIRIATSKTGTNRVSGSAGGEDGSKTTSSPTRPKD